MMHFVQIPSIAGNINRHTARHNFVNKIDAYKVIWNINKTKPNGIKLIETESGN